MDVALIAADRPLADFRKFPAAILDAGVVARLLDLRPQLEVLHHTAAPDEELVVGQLLRARGLSGDAAVLDRPQLRIAIPTSQVFAIEQRPEAVLSDG